MKEEGVTTGHTVRNEYGTSVGHWPDSATWVQNAMRVLNFSAAERLRHYPLKTLSASTAQSASPGSRKILFSYFTTDADRKFLPYFTEHGLKRCQQPRQAVRPGINGSSIWPRGTDENSFQLQAGIQAI